MTGQTAFSNVPVPHLGHAITMGKIRPVFPLGSPFPYTQLAESCWHPEADKRQEANKCS